MPTILFAAPQDGWARYCAPLRAALAERGLGDAVLTTRADPAEVDYIVHAPSGPVRDFSSYTGLRAVLSLWAGVEDVVANPTLKAPLARMVDDGLRAGMRDWVCGHVLRHHLGMDAHIRGQDGIWRAGIAPPLAEDRTVGILGLGDLGVACAAHLAAFGFRTLGWARTPKDIPSVETHHGAGGSKAVLARSEILVLLLPDTLATRNILNAATLALLPEGAVIVNPGRGTLIDDGALLAALESGRVAHATLDVFRTEPLPPDHPYWSHPKVTVTPHVASETRVRTAAARIAENIRRAEDGAPLIGLVDRARGY